MSEKIKKWQFRQSVWDFLNENPEKLKTVLRILERLGLDIGWPKEIW